MATQDQPSPNAEAVNQNKRNFSIFLICVGIAMLFWFLIALSKEYSTTIAVPVQFINTPGKKLLSNELPKQLKFNVKGKGFSIISHYVYNANDTLQIDLKSLLSSNKWQTDDQSIYSLALVEQFNKYSGNNFSVNHISPDSLFFSFSSAAVKQVRVRPIYSLQLDPQYDTTGPPTIIPPFVELTGAASALKKINEVTTVPFTISGAKESITTTTKLSVSGNIAVSEAKIKVIIPIEKLTEGTMEVDLHAINIPNGYSLKVFPNKVIVKYKVALSKYDDVVNSMFDATVDAQIATKPGVERLKILVNTVPTFVRSITVSPAEADFILTKK